MEHKDLDKLFRDSIAGDDSKLNKEESTLKELIWDQIERPSKVRKFHFWKIAAAILFLLLSGTSWILFHKIEKQKEKYKQLEKAFLQAKENQIAQKETTKNIAPLKVEKQATTKTEPTPVLSRSSERDQGKTKTGKEPIVEIVYVKDTVWIKEEISPTPIVAYIKDTVFVEIPIPPIAKWVDQKDTIALPKVKKKRPSKVEFVFGKKELDKPNKKSSIIIENGVAKKTEKQKDGIIIIPFDN